MRKLLFILVLLAFSLVRPAEAAKLRVRVGSALSPSRGISFSTARLSRATRSVIVTVLNLDKAQKITYELRYTANGIPQGAIGTILPGGKTTDTRDLYFGTCSRGVCTPHTNITGASLVVRTTTTGGGVNTKRYRVKI